MNADFWLCYGILSFIAGAGAFLLVWRLWLLDWLLKKWIASLWQDRQDEKDHWQ
jgi:hypothetical protein